MNTPNLSALDGQELLHLAVAASDRNETDRAIGLLKQAIEVEPGLAKAHYLLGAEHAQIGLFDRAMVEMQQAISIDPDLDAARFQLGLLQLTSRQVDAAKSTWQWLNRLGVDHYFVLFKSGLEHLARDEFVDCVRCLRQGIALNGANAPLNNDMERLAKQAETMAGKDGPPDSGATEPSGSGHLLVNAYNRRQH